MQQTQQAYAAKERQQLYNIKPEWQDPETYARVDDAIFGEVREYGFTRAEADSVMDHRLKKLLWDFHTMRNRFREANATRKREVEASTARRVRSTRDEPRGRQAADQQELQAVSELRTSDPRKIAAVRNLIEGGQE